MTRLRKIIEWLLPSNAPDPLSMLLLAWRLWVLGAVLGGLAGVVLYTMLPPDFEARATVVVDNNLESAWQFFPDKSLFYFLDREARKLEEVAWADATLQVVAAEVKGTSVDNLRGGVLLLSQPAEAGWHFYSRDPNPQRAAALAAAWAAAFVEQAQAGIAFSPELQSARTAMDTALLASETPDMEVVAQIAEEIRFLSEHTQGISPYIELYLSQEDTLPAAPRTSQAEVALLGSGIGAAGLAILALFLKGSWREPSA
jgi:hypothetical protein